MSGRDNGYSAELSSNEYSTTEDSSLAAARRGRRRGIFRPQFICFPNQSVRIYVTEGDLAPEFTLPGLDDDDGFTAYSLANAIDQDRAVLLLFYPFDFSPVCTNELCAIRDAEFFRFTPDVDVWAVSGDSVYAHRAFADEYELNFPLLSDSHGRVATAYDVCYEEWENHQRVPKRAVFLIDPDREVQYAWHTDDAFEVPDFFPVKDALDALVAEREDFGYETAELSVDYSGGPGEVV